MCTMGNWKRTLIAIGKAVAAERLHRGWSQKYLARRANLTRDVIAHLEVGRGCQLKTLYQLAKAFDVIPAALLPVAVD